MGTAAAVDAKRWGPREARRAGGALGKRRRHDGDERGAPFLVYGVVTRDGPGDLEEDKGKASVAEVRFPAH